MVFYEMAIKINDMLLSTRTQGAGVGVEAKNSTIPTKNRLDNLAPKNIRIDVKSPPPTLCKHYILYTPLRQTHTRCNFFYLNNFPYINIYIMKIMFFAFNYQR